MAKAQAILFSFFIIFCFSCEKTEDTIVKITVQGSAFQPIVGANVTLFSQPGDSIIEEEEETNAAGEAIFDMSSYFEDGQFGLFVLNVEVDADSLSTNSIIQVQPEEVNELTLILQ
ncbi:MAG: hypothetical protein HKN39_00860 [Flavobacteriales bacterium]|nr:hypothetical protein [Flavobacteriales bacterium]